MTDGTPYQLAGPINPPRVPVGGGLVTVSPYAVVEQRIVELAERFGVVAAPRLLSARVDPVNQAGGTTVSLDLLADGTEGPVFVVGLEFSEALNQCRVQLQSGARRLVEGRTLLVEDAFVTPLQETRSLHAPIVILRDDVLTVSLDGTAAGVTFEATDRIVARCLVLRSRDGSRLAGIADEIAALVMQEGEWYASSVSFNPESINDQSTQNINDDMIVQTTILLAPVSVVEGACQATSVKASIGNYDVTAALGGILTGTVDLNDQADSLTSFQPHLRYPVRRGQRIQVRAEYPGVGTPTAVRFTVLGRRLIGAALVRV